MTVDVGWLVFAAAVGYYVHELRQRVLAHFFPELYSIGRRRTVVRVICPDCQVGEPHVCPLLDRKGESRPIKTFAPLVRKENSTRD